MKLNPIIPQRKNLQDQLWEVVQPSSTFQIDMELKHQKRIYYSECCDNLPIDAYTTPSLHLLCQSAKERLHVTDNVIFQVDRIPFIEGSSYVSGNDKYPSIVTLSAGAVDRLNEKELSFLIGHELGRVISRDGLVSLFFNNLPPKAKVLEDILHNMHVLDLLTKLEADRYGYLACNCDMDAFVSFVWQKSIGIDVHKFGVSTSTYLKANLGHAQKFMYGGWLGKRHPAYALRIEAIRVFATSKNNRELQVKMQPIIDSIMKCED
ncbi:MAG: hypothetical protein J6P74_01915 [Paludibacteraceae bacterium]|nr:hypothetical protein [Paludibacteraceae bacterium]